MADTEQLVETLVAINLFLTQKVEQEPSYQQLITELEQLIETIQTNGCSSQQISKKITQTLKRFFVAQKGSVWLQIQQQKEPLQGESPEKFRKRINQTCRKINKYKQNILKDIRYSLNQAKTDLVNPFISISLIYKVSKSLEEAEIAQQKERQKKYLHLLFKDKDYSQRIHTYVLNLCLTELNQWLETEWKLVQTSYGNGGLIGLLDYVKVELEFIYHLHANYAKFEPAQTPILELNKFISPLVLEESSTVTFDYQFTQSSWFRLCIAVVAGLVIFRLSGRLFGFVFLVFQIINLLTGKDTKTIKLKQQTKELKRSLDNKYQFLVRFLAERTLQTAINAVDNEGQRYQEMLEAIAQSTDAKLTQIRQTIKQHKERLNNLKQDEEKIQNMLRF